MNDWMPLLVIVALFAPVLIAAALLILDRRRELRALDAFARRAREIRDWERKHAPDQPSRALRPFRDTFSGR